MMMFQRWIPRKPKQNRNEILAIHLNLCYNGDTADGICTSDSILLRSFFLEKRDVQICGLSDGLPAVQALLRAAACLAVRDFLLSDCHFEECPEISQSRDCLYI